MVSYVFQTRKGAVSIVPEKSGRWQVVYDGQGLGSYPTPASASDDVAGGHTFMPSDGTDLGSLGISPDIGDWEQQR